MYTAVTHVSKNVILNYIPNNNLFKRANEKNVFQDR